MERILRPVKRLAGHVSVPGDKSISHRAIMLGAIAEGETKIRGMLYSDDTNHTIRAFRDLGVSIETAGSFVAVNGKGLGGLKKPERPIFVGESGTTARLLAGVLAGQDFETMLEASESLSKRPMGRVIKPLSLMGARIEARDGEYMPLRIRGGTVKPITYKMPVPSAQVKSAILLAGLYADGATEIEEIFQSRDHTERMMKYFGSDIRTSGLRISVTGGKPLCARSLEVPGDISSASFFMVAALILKGSKISIKGVGINPTRAGILKIISEMGPGLKISANKKAFEPVGDIDVVSCRTKGVEIPDSMIPSVIDELPAICVLASLSRGRTIIRGAGELKVKETDRIVSMKENLGAMGANIRLEGDAIVIDGVGRLKGARLKSYGDHRTCMAMAVAASAAEGDSVIDDAVCVGKSFPTFFETLAALAGRQITG
jgi:3-phosphoshikimate 1-carboxyvinyltransferase